MLLTRPAIRNIVGYMKRNRRLSVALHVLVHLAEPSRGLRTSEDLARCVGTNPVVIRRTLAGLREAGFVRSAAGPGGGWSLARAPEEISLGEVCRALGERLLYAVELAAPTGCEVQAAVTGVMDDFLHDAEALLLERLDRLSIAGVASRVHPSTAFHKDADNDSSH
jgi:Rrf2 family protein